MASPYDLSPDQPSTTLIRVSHHPRPRVDSRASELSSDALASVMVWAQAELVRRQRAELSLTRREHQVLERLVEGDSYKDIAVDLSVALSTVQTHVRTLYRKLEVHSAAEAVARALRENLVVYEPVGRPARAAMA